jgi:hypothetical protein
VLGAIELEVDVREDGITRLPGVPAGRARVLVLLPEKAPLEKRSLGLPFGLDRGKIRVADDFDVLPEDIQAAFEGNGT